LSIFKVLLTLLSLLLLTLLGYALFKNSNNQKESLPRVIHIEQMTLPVAPKIENDATILSDLKQYIDTNKQYANSLQSNEDKILQELKMFTAKNTSQDDIIKSIKEEGLLIKKEIQILSANIDKKIDKKIKVLKKDIDRNTKKIHKKIASVNKKSVEKIQNTIERKIPNTPLISPAYVLEESDQNLHYGEIQTIAASTVYKIDEAGPIQEPIDISTQEEIDNLEELNFVQTLGVVEVSEPYLSTDEVM